jgi:hypothetical protein
VRAPFISYLSILALSILAVGCAAQISPPTGTSIQCSVNSDQASLFMGHWASAPIPIAVVANDFSASELDAINAALQTWNDFFTASKGIELYLSGSSNYSVVSSNGSRVNQSTVCGETLYGANGFTGNVMIYKNTSWSYGSAIMALTSACPITVSSSAYPKFVSAVMEINYLNYWNAGQPIPDLQSIVTHELGHVLGLNHSCVGDGCDNAPDDYAQAIMYPTLGFNGTAGQVKRTLNTNDQERANCLY